VGAVVIQGDGSSKDSAIVYFDSDGNGPLYHVCADGVPIRMDRVREWLDRQVLLGMSREHQAVVERLIEDLR